MKTLRPALLALCLVSTACGPAGRPGGGDGDGGVTADNGAQKMVEAVCSYMVRCQAFPVPLDHAECAHLMGRSMGGFDGPGALFAAVKAGKATLDAAKAQQCLDFLRAISCEQGLASLDAEAICMGAFTGLVPASGACIADAECVRGTRCKQSDSTTDSECVAACVALAAGECADSRDCTDGKKCSNDRCIAVVPPGGSGQPCGTGGACQSGLRCIDNKCTTLPGENATCEPGSSCAAGLTCVPSNDFSTATCIRPKAKDESCTRLFECGGLLAATLYCDSGTGKCRERPSSGACATEFGLCNTETAWCDPSATPSPTCKPFLALGAPCTDGAQCGTVFSGRDCEAVAGGARCAEETPVVCTP